MYPAYQGVWPPPTYNPIMLPYPSSSRNLDIRVIVVMNAIAISVLHGIVLGSFAAVKAVEKCVIRGQQIYGPDH